MKKKMNRLLSLLLVLTMLLGLFPAMELTAAASGETALTSSGGSLATGSYILNEDVELTNDITIASGAAVTIDLNGHILKGSRGGSVITNNGTLTIRDTGVKQVYYCERSTYSGRWTINTNKTSGSYYVTGGCITGGYNVSGDRTGGGIYNTGTLILEGGNIIGSEAWDGQGSGVYNASGASFTMTGGSIVGNTVAYGTGGGVYNAGTFIMTGGSITDNMAGEGGGVYYADGTVTLGGTAKIKDNTLYVEDMATSSRGLKLKSLAPQNPGNLCLASGKTISIADGENAPAAGMEIWVSPIGTQYTAGNTFITGTTASDCHGYFKSDNSCYL